MNRQLSTEDLDLDPAEQTLAVVGDMDSPPPLPGFDVDTPAPPPPSGFNPNATPPSPGFDVETPPPHPSGFNPNATPPPPTGFVPDVGGSADSLLVPQITTSDNAVDDYSEWSDEMLIAQGWTQWQVDTWRAQQGGVEAPQTSPVSPVLEVAQLEVLTPVETPPPIEKELSANHPAAGFNFSESVVDSVMQKHGITDKEAFMTHAIEFDTDGNNYLNGKELEEAAKSFTN
jgi:hypothetical protein